MQSSQQHQQHEKYPSTMEFTPEELARLRQILYQSEDQIPPMFKNASDASLYTANSDYPEFTESTHAWAVFAEDPSKRASALDRFVGTIIIMFQLFTYWIFTSEAIEDYQKGAVQVFTKHDDCLEANEQPQDNFMCEAEKTNMFDAFIAFFMLGVFLAADFQQAARAIRSARFGTPLLFACLAGVEVVCAFLSASISISQSLYIGEVTDAVEVGVGLLFIRELSTRAYHGISNKKKGKDYATFFGVCSTIVIIGLFSHPVYEAMFASS